MHNAGKMIFPARKLMNYLVVPNNLLLSLSLSLSSSAPGVYASYFSYTYAREVHLMPPIHKGNNRFPLVR